MEILRLHAMHVALIVGDMLGLDFVGGAGDPVPSVFGPIGGLQIFIQPSFLFAEFRLDAHGLCSSEKRLSHLSDFRPRGNSFES